MEEKGKPTRPSMEQDGPASATTRIKSPSTEIQVKLPLAPIQQGVPEEMTVTIRTDGKKPASVLPPPSQFVDGAVPLSTPRAKRSEHAAPKSEAKKEARVTVRTSSIALPAAWNDPDNAEGLEELAAITGAAREVYRASRREEGCLRFDMMTLKDDPCKLILYEVSAPGRPALAAERMHALRTCPARARPTARASSAPPAPRPARST